MHALALSLLLAAPPMPKADAGPVAALSAPATSTVGTPIYLDLSGSSGDAFHFFVGKSSPSQPKVVTIKDDNGVVTYGLVVPQTAGVYKFGLAAWGPPVPPPAYPAVDVTIIQVTVSGGPNPPGPTPPPSPPSALTATFQAAYALDTDASKATYLADLATTFQGAAKLITPGMTVAQLGTALSAKIHAAGHDTHRQHAAPTGGRSPRSFPRPWA